MILRLNRQYPGIPADPIAWTGHLLHYGLSIGALAVYLEGQESRRRHMRARKTRLASPGKSEVEALARLCCRSVLAVVVLANGGIYNQLLIVLAQVE